MSANMKNVRELWASRGGDPHEFDSIVGRHNSDVIARARQTFLDGLDRAIALGMTDGERSPVDRLYDVMHELTVLREATGDTEPKPVAHKPGPGVREYMQVYGQAPGWVKTAEAPTEATREELLTTIRDYSPSGCAGAALGRNGIPLASVGYSLEGLTDALLASYTITPRTETKDESHE